MRKKLFFAILVFWVVGVIALLYLYWSLWASVIR